MGRLIKLKKIYILIKRLKQWLKQREADYDFREKARLCKPCDKFCGNDLCKKVGCLNMDMRTNSTRLKLLVLRLEQAGYKFKPSKKEDPSNIVNLDDFRK